MSTVAESIHTPHPLTQRFRTRATHVLTRSWRRTNLELVLLLALFALTGLLNAEPLTQRVVLNLFIIPSVLSAYVFGRRHATLTAFSSALVVALLALSNPTILSSDLPLPPTAGRVVEMISWAAPLVISAWLMGTMYERRAEQLRELRDTYYGVLNILRHFIANDSYTENHCYRVSVYAVRIATDMGLPSSDVEDVRAAALLHDVGKLKVSRDLLHKAASLTDDEFALMKRHVEWGTSLIEPAGGALRRILPIVLSHHDRFDGSGYTEVRAEAIPLGARILAVADTFDAMTSDRPYRRAVTPLEAKAQVERGAGTEVEAWGGAAVVRVHRRGELDLTPVVL